jgi:hypothetical protein
MQSPSKIILLPAGDLFPGHLIAYVISVDDNKPMREYPEKDII